MWGKLLCSKQGFNINWSAG